MKHLRIIQSLKALIVIAFTGTTPLLAQNGAWYPTVPHYNQDWHPGSGDCLPNSAVQVLGYHDQQDHSVPNPWPRLIPKGCSSYASNPNGYNAAMNAMKDSMDWWSNRGTVPTLGWLWDAVGTQVKNAAKTLDSGASGWWVDDDDWTSWNNMKNQINNYGPMMLIVFPRSNDPYYYGTFSGPSSETSAGTVGDATEGHSMCMLGWYEGTKIGVNAKWVIVDMGWSSTSPAWINYDYGGTDLYTVEVRTTGTPNSTDPLDAPTGVSSTDGTYTDRVRVTWNSVSGATAYEVWNNTSNNSGSASKLNDVAGSTNYDDTSATAGTTYYYWIKAKYSCSGSSGISGFSSSDSGYASCPLAGTPGGVAASDGTYCGYVRISWNAVAGVTSYLIYRDGNYVAENASSPYDDTPGDSASHSYTVKAKNGCGTGIASSANSGWANAISGTPTGVSASDGTYCGFVRVTWNAVSGATLYEVFRDGNKCGESAGTSLDDSPGDTAVHSYTVKAEDTCGLSGSSSANSGYARSTLSGPTGLSATDGTQVGFVRITWNVAGGATGYEVFRDGGKVGDAAGTSYDDYPGDTSSHSYTVKTKNDCGGGPASGADNGSAGGTPPSPVTITASSGAGGFIQPSGTFTKNKGDSVTFNATPDSNYTVDTWKVDGSVVQNGGTSYTISNIQKEYTVQVTFKWVNQPVTITASSGAAGFIQPSGPFTKNKGDSVTFNATPDSNYTVDTWKVDGSVVQTGGTHYTLSNIQANCSVQVTFTYGGTGAFQSIDIGTDVFWNNNGQIIPWTIPGLGSTVPIGVDGYDVVAAGLDIWNVYDAFRYVYQPIDGDFDVRVQVQSLIGQDVWAKAGLMVRESLEETTRAFSILVTPTTGMNVCQVVMRRFGWDSTVQLASQSGVPYPNAWLRIVRTGNQLSAYTSNNGTAWSLMQQSNLPLPNSVFIGMATTAHDYNNAGITAIASYRSFQVTSTPFTEPKKALKRQVYKDIPGGFITDLTGSPAFPNTPSMEDYVAEFESSMSLDNYGEKLSGYLIPPITGNYQFYLASDDASKVWLSTDESPANKQLIVEETAWNAPRNFEGQYGPNPPTRWDTGEAMPQRVSSSIYLEAGKYYYVEVLHKQGVGGDQVSVTWKTPGGTAPANGSEPILGDYLSPVGPVTKPIATVALGNLSQTYDGAAKTATATTTPAGLTVNFTYNGSPSAPVNAGSYTVIGTVNDLNYQGSATNTLVLGKATPTVATWPTATAITYGQTLASSTLSGGAASVAGTFAFTTPGTAPAAGTAAQGVTFTPTATINYHPVSGTVSVTVNKATATVTLGSLSQTYNGTGKSATATTDPAGLNVDFTYGGSGTAPTSAGSYAVVGTVNNANYQGSATGTLVIGKATATATLGNLSQIYDGSAKSLTATTTPAGLAVNFAYDGSATPPVTAGSYAVVGTINDANYTGSASGALVVGKATATIILANLSQTYDGMAKSASASTTPSGLSVNLTYDGSATAPVTAGSYAVIGTINNANYMGSAGGTMVIGKATATVTLGNLSQTYDGSAKSATATTTPAGLTVNFTYEGSATAPVNVGSYAVVGTINDANYTGSASGALVVGKATATIILANLSQTYDGTAKSASASTTPSGLSVNLTYDGSATAPVTAGSYAVIGTINNANYTGSAGGTMVIGKATATVTLGNLSQTYDGSAKSVTATTTPAGLTVNFTYEGSATAPVNVGSYAVVGTVNDPNYQGSATNTLVIDKATATLALGSLSQTYDGAAKTATATTTPAGLTVNFTYNGSPSAPVNAGSYPVLGTINDPNYQGSATDTLVIGNATATVALGSLSQTYDGVAMTATATTTPAGLTVNFTYNGSPSAPVNAGSYTVIGTVNDPNYQGSATDTLVIGKATATVALGSLSQTYDGVAKTATATTTPAGLTVNLTYNGSPSAPINAGSYTVIGTVNDANYQGSSTEMLIIADRAVTLTTTPERWNNIITIGWPTKGFKLQSSPVLTATNWQDVAGSETTNSWSVTIGASNQFYRLKQ